MSAQDYEMVQQCLSGDRNAFRPIVERYQRMVFETVVRMVYDRETARDLTQEVFVKAYTRLDTYNPKFPMKAWLQKIAVNRSIDYLRSRKPEYLILDNPVNEDHGPYAPQIPDDAPSPSEQMEISETADRVKRAVFSLEPKLKAIVILRHFQDLNYDQIADLLKIPIGTVKNRLFRARERLQSILVNESIASEVKNEVPSI